MKRRQSDLLDFLPRNTARTKVIYIKQLLDDRLWHTDQLRLLWPLQWLIEGIGSEKVTRERDHVAHKLKMRLKDNRPSSTDSTYISPIVINTWLWCLAHRRLWLSFTEWVCSRTSLRIGLADCHHTHDDSDKAVNINRSIALPTM